jgi:hypothetical protein
MGSNALYPRRENTSCPRLESPYIHGATSVSAGSAVGCTVLLMCKNKHVEYEQEEYQDNMKLDATGSTVSFSQLSITNENI